jgi:hypothetical protein
MQHIPQQASLSQVRRELRYRFRQQAAHLAPRASFLGVLLLRRNTAAESLFAVAFALVQGSNLSVAALP